MDEPVGLPVSPATSFEVALLPHRDAAYNLAHWLMRNPQEAEDCVQESYVRAYRAFDRFRGGDGRTWFLTIVRHVCYSRIREQRRKGTLESFDETFHTDTLDLPDHSVWKAEDARTAVPLALERLAPEYREILILHEVEGLPYKEIAATIDVPIGTVMSRLSRARSKLEHELRQLLRKESRS